MGSELRHSNVRWLLFVGLTLSSILFTGCEKGSLGVKNGTVVGYVFEEISKKPIPDVLIRGQHSGGPAGGAAQNITQDVTTGPDGKYVLTDLEPGTWDIVPQKPGYLFLVSSSSADTHKVTANIQNGETTQAPIIEMRKAIEYMKGTLKGYPVDLVTGSPLMNFTVKQTSPNHQIRSKLFESAQEFKENGWSGLEGGAHEYMISCDNYLTFTGSATITNTAFDMGLIKMQPETVSVAGTLRNLPGYIIGAQNVQVDFQNWMFWAEAGGKVVASQAANTGDTFKGTVVYTLSNVPATVGQIAVKCKIRGYDVVTINPAVNIPAQRPSGIIAGVDADFANIDPIRRDLRVVVQGDAPQPPNKPIGSFGEGEVCRIYVKQGGKEVVPYVDVVGHNDMAEAFFSGIMAGYPIEVLAVNLNRGYISGGKSNFVLEENGNSAFTIQVKLSEGGTPN